MKEYWKGIKKMGHMLSVLFLTPHGRDYYSIFPITNAMIETLHASSCPFFKQGREPYTECFPCKHLSFLTTILSTRKTLGKLSDSVTIFWGAI